jgi:hypothetical protein
MIRVVSVAVMLVAVVGLTAQPPGGPPPGGSGSGGVPIPSSQPPAEPPSQKKDDGPKSAAKAGPQVFDVKLADDSTVRVTPIDPALSVTTKYGKLTIPVADVRRIDFGFRFPDGVEAKIKQAVDDLGSPVFQAREEAQKSLLGFAELSVPALKGVANSPDKEVATRAAAVLKQLKEKLPDEKYNLRDYDVVETAEFTFQGTVEATVLKVTTQYFGQTTLKVADVRSVRGRGAGAGGNEVINVDAAEYGKVNDQAWLDTGLEVSADRPLELVTTGSVDLWPQQPGGYVVSADGQPRQGTAPPIIGPNGQPHSYAPGQLIGRIGTSGTPFVVGANYKTTRPGATGKLYLKIAASPWGNNSTGTYKVTVKAGG